MGRGDAAACGRAAPRPRDGSRADSRRRRCPRVRRVVDAIRDRRFPHKDKLNSVLGSSKTDLVVSEAFVVEVYMGCGGLCVVGFIAAAAVNVAVAVVALSH